MRFSKDEIRRARLVLRSATVVLIRRSPRSPLTGGERGFRVAV